MIFRITIAAALSLALMLPVAGNAGIAASQPAKPHSAVLGVRTAGIELALVDGVWTDRNHRPGLPLLAIRRGSNAFSSLLDLLPRLQPVFKLGDHVIVNVGSCSVAVSGRGLEYATPDDLVSLIQAGEWAIGTL